MATKKPARNYAAKVPAHTSKRKKAKKRAVSSAKMSPINDVKSGRLARLRSRLFRRKKPIKPLKKIDSVWRLTKRTSVIMWQNWKLLGGIALVYGLLTLVLAKSFSMGTNVSQLKSDIADVFAGHGGSVASSFAIFTVLLTSSGSSSSDAAGVYQTFFFLIGSLATIWALRRIMAGEATRIRDAFYVGMTPLVPFVLIICVMGLQLIPLLVGGSLYYTVTSNGIAVTVVEKIIWALVFGVLALISLYMITSSIFALYIVTLPNMTPMKALRSARDVVRYRRWLVLRKILFLPLLFLLIGLVVMIPVILVVPVIAPWIFFVLTILGLIVGHTYLYSLYRELL